MGAPSQPKKIHARFLPKPWKSGIATLRLDILNIFLRFLLGYTQIFEGRQAPSLLITIQERERARKRIIDTLGFGCGGKNVHLSHVTSALIKSPIFPPEER